MLDFVFFAMLIAVHPLRREGIFAYLTCAWAQTLGLELELISAGPLELPLPVVLSVLSYLNCISIAWSYVLGIRIVPSLCNGRAVVGLTVMKFVLTKVSLACSVLYV